jgi:hypothetical protein
MSDQAEALEANRNRKPSANPEEAAATVAGWLRHPDESKPRLTLSERLAAEPEWQGEDDDAE